MHPLYLVDFVVGVRAEEFVAQVHEIYPGAAVFAFEMGWDLSFKFRLFFLFNGWPGGSLWRDRVQ